ncbi:STAS domain-containing protein [Chloroflexus sp.]|uniref:STAS domain-containing protein n=1 Tax=Chloroflexus sp. TaxID=1904827 RepID=UPI00260D29BC|nr:STAS domain-containing protein [uncultured Chloroflexus sp.]
MSATLLELAGFIRERLPRESERLCRTLQETSSGYAAIPADELRPALQRSVETICALFGDQDSKPVQAWAPQIGERRARMGLSLDDMMTVVSVIREFCWQELDTFGNERLTINDVRMFEDAINEFNRLLLLGYSQAMISLQQELRDQAEQIEAQQQTIRELSTPILPLYEGILVLPLVGAIDSFRAGQIMERLLTAIAERQSDIVIIDITGVPVIDTAVANYLLQTARAAQLIGAQVILVGIGPEIAQTIVQLGVDLSGIAIGANLQAGIELALSRLGFAIR